MDVATLHEEFAVLIDGVYTPVASYADGHRFIASVPEGRLVRRTVSDWNWTS